MGLAGSIHPLSVQSFVEESNRLRQECEGVSQFVSRRLIASTEMRVDVALSLLLNDERKKAGSAHEQMDFDFDLIFIPQCNGW